MMERGWREVDRRMEMMNGEGCGEVSGGDGGGDTAIRQRRRPVAAAAAAA